MPPAPRLPLRLLPALLAALLLVVPLAQADPLQRAPKCIYVLQDPPGVAVTHPDCFAYDQDLCLLVTPARLVVDPACLLRE